jgi:UDP-N-acetylmuramoylalanine--D-glutamate ligase
MSGGIELRGKRVLVVGLARTGVAVSLFCAARGAKVTATDKRSEQELADAAQQLRQAGVLLELGGHTERTFLHQDLIVPSPGVPANDAFLEKARAKGITLWSEIELAFRFLEGKLIGITGSNGKTTTATLTHHILRQAGFETLLAGNVGTPLIAVVEQMKSTTVTVAELSSFQLELTERFRPDIGVFLNLTPDHLDRHGTMAAYGAAKARMFARQNELDAAVLNADDAASAEYAPQRPQVFWFSRKKDVAQGACVKGQEIVVRRAEKEELVMRVAEIPLAGAHNLENVLAATTATRLAGVEPGKIASGVKSFAGVEHRLEFVAEIGGVKYYNDSKATNVDATVKALESFPGHIRVILGGKDKESDYTVLRGLLQEKGVQALLIGAAADKIAGQIAGSVQVEHAGTMDRAVEIAARAAQPGDVVLLAPACASFDQFRNYEERGRVFKELVRARVGNSQGAGTGKG